MKTPARQKCDDYYFLDYFFRFCQPVRENIPVTYRSAPTIGQTVDQWIQTERDEWNNQLEARLQLQQARLNRELQQVQASLRAIQVTTNQLAKLVNPPTVKEDGAKVTEVAVAKKCTCQLRTTFECNCPMGSFYKR